MTDHLEGPDVKVRTWNKFESRRLFTHTSRTFVGSVLGWVWGRLQFKKAPQRR